MDYAIFAHIAKSWQILHTDETKGMAMKNMKKHIGVSMQRKAKKNKTQINNCNNNNNGGGMNTKGGGLSLYASLK